MVTLMLAIAAPYNSPIPALAETPEETRARYESIATDVASVVYDEKESPMIQGIRGREASAAILLSIAFHESSFRKAVDKNIGPGGRGDHGDSWCLMQLNVGKGRTIPWHAKENRPAYRECKENEVSTKAYRCDKKEEITAGWSGPELIDDRKKCIRASYRYMKMSFGACQHLPVTDRLSAYASGSCISDFEPSKRRMNLGLRWFAKSPKIVDADVLKEIEESNKSKPPQILVPPAITNSPENMTELRLIKSHSTQACHNE